jgi:hypothetical protein
MLSREAYFLSLIFQKRLKYRCLISYKSLYFHLTKACHNSLANKNYIFSNKVKLLCTYLEGQKIGEEKLYQKLQKITIKLVKIFMEKFPQF